MAKIYRLFVYLFHIAQFRHLDDLPFSREVPTLVGEGFFRYFFSVLFSIRLFKPLFLLRKHLFGLKEYETGLGKHNTPASEAGYRSLEAPHRASEAGKGTPEARHRAFKARNATPEAGMALLLPVNSRSRFILLPFFVVSRQNVVASRCTRLPNPARSLGLLPSPSYKI